MPASARPLAQGPGQGQEKRPAANASGPLAALCKAASDPLRLDVLRVLHSDSFGVQELAAIFGLPQPGMSHHLKILATSGLAATRRQGNSIYYRRAVPRGDDHIQAFQAALLAAVDAVPVPPEQQERVGEVYAERSAQSRSYFEKNADKFAESQGMLCELSQYLPSLKELLDLTELPAASRVLEVGPGQGELLLELAARYDHLVALDSSVEMLTLTKGKLKAKEREGRIRFTQSSLEAYDPPAGEAYDAVVLNMVLHHMSSPQQALTKLRRLVREGGYLLVADLGLHNQDWTRASCGDIWLGFDAEELCEWAAQAGFAETQSVYLGLKNGFQIQLRLLHAV